MSRYQMPDREDEIRELSFDRSGGKVKFLISRRSGFNFSTSYEVINRFFDPDYIRVHGCRVATRGGRGQTLLYTLPYKLIGGLYGPKKDLELAASIRAQRRSGIIKREDNLVLPDLDEVRDEYHLVLRHYCRGGMARFFKDSFWRFDSWACRSRIEFELCTELYRRGLPVPRPLIAREQCGAFFVTNDIVVEQIPGTRNLAEVLEQEEDITDSVRWAIGSTLAKFFAEGVWHSDLNIRNILIDEQDKCWIIDFDKCEIRNPLSDNDKIEMLERLERSFNKEKRLRELENLDVDAIMYDIRAAVAYIPDENDLDLQDEEEDELSDDDSTLMTPAEPAPAAPPAAPRRPSGIPAALTSHRDKTAKTADEEDQGTSSQPAAESLSDTKADKDAMADHAEKAEAESAESADTEAKDDKAEAESADTEAKDDKDEAEAESADTEAKDDKADDGEGDKQEDGSGRKSSRRGRRSRR